MTKYREILRLHNLGLSQKDIAGSCNVSKKTVNKVLKAAKEKNIFWPLSDVYFAPTLPSARTFPATITLYFCHRHGASCHLDWNVA